MALCADVPRVQGQTYSHIAGLCVWEKPKKGYTVHGGHNLGKQIDD